MNAITERKSGCPPLSEAKRIIVAGLGAMGLPMANRLYKDGFNVFGFDIVSPNDQHLPLLPQLSDLTGDDSLLVVVRDASQVEEICFTQQAVFKAPTYPKTLIVCSTISPNAIYRLSDQLPKDVCLIDAPMSGAPYRAKNGTLTFMIGGEPLGISPFKPLFQSLGSDIHYLGELGSGMTAKVLNNYVAASSVVAVRRVLSRAHQLEMDQDQLLQVMSSSSGATWYGDHLDSIEWAQQSYNKDNTIGILEKDVHCLLDMDLIIDDNFDHELLAALRTLPAFPGRNP